jgi:2,3-diaminopropionate biosynthesis protein SbnA
MLVNTTPSLPFGIGNTPLLPVLHEFGNRSALLCLKLEGANPFGSIKDRTALSIIQQLEAQGRLHDGSSIIESSSGNLAVALANISRQRGYGMVAVVDPMLSPPIRRRLEAAQATVHTVTKRDAHGGYLLERLACVEAFCSGDPNLVWTDQYRNPANPEAHFLWTGPEVYKQMDSTVDALFVPVSTGGTLSGLSRFFRTTSPNTTIVAVDAIGSVALGGKASPRSLTGIGSSRRSDFISLRDYDQVCYVDAPTALAFRQLLFEGTGINIGGSAAATVAAASTFLSHRQGAERVVCICPDFGENYEFQGRNSTTTFGVRFRAP